MLENTLLAALGSLAGLALALLIAQIVGGIEITIDLPWDISSTPYFLPEATLDRTEIVTAPLEISPQIMAIAGFGGVLVELLAAILAV